ncbi:MAG TPA: tetratricopeptide repeat protein [Candidatus Angelobacter sp.]
MKTIATLFLILTIVISTPAQNAANAQSSPSPAEQNIAKARKLIDQNPKNFEAYNALALALSRRARETSDVAYYAQAEEALQKSFSISPENFDGARVHAWLLLGKHEFAAALEEATKLNKKMPDDITVYGFLTDANVELGNYNAAETAAQRMLDLRPGTLVALTRAAYLRELFGDVDGSLELMNMAFQSTPPSEVEDGAWILTQMAHLKLSVGRTGEAETLLSRALTMFPNYHYALANLAKVRIQQKRYADAVALLEKRYQAAPHAENLYDLAKVLQLSGRMQEAGKAFAEFEQKSLVETVRADNSNHELIFYYADHANQPAKALQVAGREIARRHDIYTLDSYAWALFVNGQYAAARKQIEAALAPGVRDARLFRHAGEIALKNGDRAAAESYLRQAIELNAPGSDQARKTLNALGSTLAGR